MSKRLPIRYVSESAIKHALKIDTFREMSKDKIMQFASMMPYMNKDVAFAIINQFPMLADLHNKKFLDRITKKIDWYDIILFYSIRMESMG